LQKLIDCEKDLLLWPLVEFALVVEGMLLLYIRAKPVVAVVAQIVWILKAVSVNCVAG